MKKLTALFLALAMCLSLAACGGSSSGGSGNGGSSDDNVMSLSVSGTESDAYTKAIKDLVEEFNANNEFGVTIEPEFQATSDYKTKLSTTMASDAEPDIFFTYELSFLGNYVNGDKVVDLQEYLNADEAWASSFNGGVLDQVTYNGDVYAIPFAQSVAVMYYNKDIFAQYGLSVPTTYDEYCKVCDTLVQNGVTPVALASTSDDAWLVSQYIQQLSNGIAGYELFDSLNKGTGKWNDPAFIQAAQLFQAEIDKGYFEKGFTGVGNDEACAHVHFHHLRLHGGNSRRPGGGCHHRRLLHLQVLHQHHPSYLQIFHRHRGSGAVHQRLERPASAPYLPDGQQYDDPACWPDQLPGHVLHRLRG